MATFPEDPIPKYPLTIEPEWNTLVSDLEGGSELRSQRNLFPKYNITVQYELLDATEIQTLYNFYMARKGSYEAFYIYNLILLENTAFTYSGQYIATADGTTDIYDIPGRSTSSQAIYLDGVEQTLTTHYSILTGGGISNSDRVDFVTPPTSGAIVTCDFTGFLRIRSRFAEDNMSMELFYYQLYQVGLKLKGLSAT